MPIPYAIDPADVRILGTSIVPCPSCAANYLPPRLGPAVCSKCGGRGSVMRVRVAYRLPTPLDCIVLALGEPSAS